MQRDDDARVGERNEMRGFRFVALEAEQTAVAVGIVRDRAADTRPPLVGWPG